ncbi:MAG: translocation/assembly module TamB domain-containing protein [Chryseolinea sp.]
MFRKWTPKRIIIVAVKTTGWVLVSIIGLIIVLALSIQIPSIQNKIVQKAVTYLEGKIHTKVSLGHVSLSFPKALVLKELYLEDQRADTLLYAGKLSIDTDLWALLSNTIELNDVTLENTTANINRTEKNGTFNFDYIIKSFVGEPASTPDTTSSSWKFNIGDVNLKNIEAGYVDSLAGTSFHTQFAVLEVNVDELNLDQSILSIDEIDFSDARAEMIQWKNVTDTSTNGTHASDAKGFSISLHKITLHQIAADYSNKPAGQHARMNLGDFNVSINEMDLNAQRFEIENISLMNTFLSYQQSAHQGKQENSTLSTSKEKTETNTKKRQPWDIAISNLKLDNNNIQYYDFNAPKQTKGLDFSHLWFTRFALAANGLKYKGQTMAGVITNLSLVDKSGFSITSMKGAFNVTDTSANIAGFRYVTPASTISLDAKSNFASLSTIAKDYPDASIKLNLKHSLISLGDLLYFSPELLDSIPLKVSSQTQLNVTASASGKVKDLTIHDFTVALLKSTTLSMTGTIKGLPGSDPVMSINLKKLYTTKGDVALLVADSLIPKSISLPSWMELTGKFNGTPSSPEVTAKLRTDIGDINLDGKLSQAKNSKSNYNGNLIIQNFMVGKLLSQPEKMGGLTMKATVDGSGLTMHEMNTRIDMVVNSFEYQQYTYRNFNLNGNLKRYFFTGKASMADKNLDFVLKGDLDYNKDVPQYLFNLTLKNADFKALHLTDRPLRTRFTIDVNLATSDFTTVNGNVDIRKVAVFNGEKLYTVDSLLFASIDQKGDSKISIRSDLVSGDFAGTMHLTSIPDALTSHFNEYFSLRDTAYSKKVRERQNFKFNLVIKNTELITDILIPELEPFIPGKIEGQFDSQEGILDLEASVARIRYGSVGLDSISLKVHSDKKALDYSLNLRKVLIDSLKMEVVRLAGKVANDSIRTKLTILDSVQREKYTFGGAFYSEEQALRFRFLPKEVVMHYAPWTTPVGNYLRFTKHGIIAHDFSITNINEKISLITSDEKDARTAIVFKDLNLQNITSIVEGTILADGLVNGDFTLSGTGAFKSALKVKTLKVFNEEWGDLELDVDHRSTGEYLLDVGLKGDNAEFGVKGTYMSDSGKNKIDVAANISRINLKIIEPLTGGQIKNSAGIITGELSVKGQPTSPQIRGFLAFNEASTVPAFVNSKFTLRDERITFTSDGIVLDNFKVEDDTKNVATLKGLIKTKDYSTFNLNLGLTAKNFRVLNSTSADSELFYGKVGVSTTAKITGTMTQPKITMEISLADDSDFTYVVPQSEKGVLDAEGIVRFVDKDAKKDPFLKNIDARDTVKSKFTGLDLTANIELDDKESFSIVIDPLTGDKLTVKGNSTLTADINPTGDMQLSGRYEITEGSYDFTFYKLVKRKFAIVKGSTITWAGNPLDATLAIKASYLVETSPAPLIGNPDDPANKGRLPFLVYLNINGNMLAPDISFELDMPKDKQNTPVYARIKDINTRESDLNKQVFALLILRRFISDNVFDSQGGDVGATARRSVSKLLTEQLNRLSQNIKGFELSFDVKSYDDYTTGSAQGQTQVQLGVTKSLLDNRLVVKVSGNVDIEGNASDQSSFSDYIGDLALEYKLTSDGRFRITGFRKSNYDLISGELIETGAGLIYIKDYNTLRELFRANAKDK